MSTKIVVVKLKDILKKSILVLIGIIILATIAYFFIPKSNHSQAKYNAGTYSSKIILHNNPVLIEVTVSKDEILDIALLNMKETQEVFYPLFEASIDEIASQVIENQSTVVSSNVNNNFTTKIIVDAINNALEKAKK